MPFIANLKNIEANYIDEEVGSGQCAAFVQEVVGIGHTSTWRQGQKVARNEITPGTAIATFYGGRYRNYFGLPKEQKIIYGSHVGIYIGQNEKYIEMWHQYKGKGVHIGKFYFKYGTYCDFIKDADNYFVVEPAGSGAAVEGSCWVSSEGISYHRDQW